MRSRIALNLRSLRDANRYSQEDIAEKIGVTRQTIAKWENAESLPDILKCQELAALYGIPLELLINGTLDDISLEPANDRKYVFAIVTVGERGQIVIPKRAREVFQIGQGDKLLIVGNEKQGIGIVKVDGANSIVDAGKSGKKENNERH
ncbi:MAG: helix-turn-helix domain-containing protein [Firmicutes bacterium]|nr:helix-turn-helix domain-containing protein [Bacillota bacterium]